MSRLTAANMSAGTPEWAGSIALPGLPAMATAAIPRCRAECSPLRGPKAAGAAGTAKAAGLGTPAPRPAVAGMRMAWGSGAGASSGAGPSRASETGLLLSEPWRQEEASDATATESTSDAPSPPCGCSAPDCCGGTAPGAPGCARCRKSACSPTRSGAPSLGRASAGRSSEVAALLAMRAASSPLGGNVFFQWGRSLATESAGSPWNVASSLARCSIR